MTIIPSSALITRSKDAIAAAIDEEVVLLNIKHGNYHGFKGSARRIWELTETPCTMQALCAKLAAEYDAPHERIEAEVASFVEKLVAANIAELL